MDQPLAEETPLNSLLHHTATRSLSRLKKPIIQDNGVNGVSRWAYDVILSQAAGSISPTGGFKGVHGTPPAVNSCRPMIITSGYI